MLGSLVVQVAGFVVVVAVGCHVLVLVVHLNMALRAIFEIVLLVSTFQLPLNRPCMHCRVGTAVGTLVEVVTFLDETLLELLSVETETLVPSEPQQGMQHQGTRRDGELFPVASGRKRRSVLVDKVAPWPTEGACFRQIPPLWGRTAAIW